MSAAAPSADRAATALAGVSTLVTGGAGFIGSHLVEALVDAGARVRILDDLSSGRRAHLAAVADRCELLVGDLRDGATCQQACAGVRLVFHQAALVSVPGSLERPEQTIAVNVAGTANLLAAARDTGVRRVVYASSSAVYGEPPGSAPPGAAAALPASPYALSKLMGEQLAAQFSRCCGLDSVGLRYFNVYGPRQDPGGPYGAVIPRFIAAALAGESPVVHGDGLQSRDFVFVTDAVEANLRAALAPEAYAGEPYDVASGTATTLRELLAQLGEILGELPPPRYQPPRAGDLRHSRGDPRIARERLGFSARVALAAGLRQSVEWYRHAAP